MIPTPTESDFTNNESRRLRRLAGLIRLSGLSPLTIARACNLDKRTVQRALKGLPLKSDAEARIEYFMERIIEG